MPDEIKYIFIEDTDRQEKIKKKPKRGRPVGYRKPIEKKVVGRPQVYTELLGNEICNWLSAGKTLTSYCKIEGNPSYPTIMKWLWVGNKWYREGFFNNYTIAREQQAQCMADQIIDISDDSTNDYMELEDKNGKKYIKVDTEYIQRSKLRVEVRQWIAKNLLPKVYGDKKNIELTGASGGPVTLEIIYEKKNTPEEPKE